MNQLNSFNLSDEVKWDLINKINQKQAIHYTKDEFISSFNRFDEVKHIVNSRTEEVLFDKYDNALYFLQWSENGFNTIYYDLS